MPPEHGENDNLIAAISISYLQQRHKRERRTTRAGKFVLFREEYESFYVRTRYLERRQEQADSRESHDIPREKGRRHELRRERYAPRGRSTGRQLFCADRSRDSGRCYSAPGNGTRQGRTRRANSPTTELVRDIAAQLPPGTPHADIEKFLIAKGMPQPGYFNFNGPNPRGNGETALLWTRTASVGNPIHSCWIPLLFRLDGSDALMGYTHEVRCSSYLIDGNRDQGTPLLR